MPYANRQPSTNPKLVLIHGFLDSGLAWQPLADALAASGYTSTAPDLAGAGARQAESGPYSLGRAVDEIVSHVNADTAPIALIGHSMGAQIAELAAMRLGSRVSALVLLTPTPLGGNALPDEIRSTLRESGGDALAQRSIRQTFSKNLSEAQLLTATAADVLMGSDAVRGYYDAFTGGDIIGKRPTACTAQTLILGAQDDPVISPEMVRQIQEERFPVGRLGFIAGSGHWPHIERVEATAHAITEFLQEVA
ncbi:alpha/beta fold hydrolase [Cupriavidus numazuensis]|jgi:pimeloyl-ACP methyl ester carboxylesterase|uniref:2-succinyl-6-hydroxy-2, 4-cyclohexadiene-1-carboxylate synthase n=1 Tax=Cupriavidus numazuensis TaxID=221992 RepID=A0ABN7QAZ7_9BURK|nr:alpha/beta fold hydrolase [Cupriavidus numazuensis]CAG2160636.1 2-succinyl-6-hydroxy-2, 4-cyclohexadiene-1-carboxylate synthase [Cupriavidus numazuensis]